MTSAKLNAVDQYTPYGSVTYSLNKEGVPYAQHTNVSNTMQDTIGRQELIGNAMTRIAGQRAMGIPTNDFDINNAPYGRDVGMGIINQMGLRGDPRSSMPYDPRNQSVGLSQFDPNAVGHSQAGFNVGRFGEFGDQRGQLGNDPRNFNVNEFQNFGDQRSNMPYDPRGQSTQNFAQYNSDAERAAGPYDPRGQQSNMEVYEDQRSSNPFDPRNISDINAYNDRVNDAFMARQRRNLEPLFSQQYERQMQDLANRGLDVGGRAYGRALSDLNRNQENAWIDASNNAILQSGAEAERMLGMQRGLRSDAMQEGFATNQAINQSEAARLAAEQGINQQAFQQGLAGTAAQNQAAQAGLGAEQAIRNQAWNESTGQYGLNQQAVQNRLQAGMGLRGQAFNEATQQYDLNQGAVQRQLDAGTRLRDQAFNEAAQANQLGNQTQLQQLGEERNIRGAAMNEDNLNWQQRQADLANMLQTTQGYRNQAIQEDLMSRQQNAQEVAALLGASPNLPTPQAPNMPTYGMQAPDVIGAYNQSYQNQLAAHQMQQQQNASMWQGAAGLAGIGARAMKSSVSFKEDDGPAERILDRVKNLEVRTWRYKRHIDPRQELHIGPYAEDWQRVLGLGNGTHIDVIDAFGVVLKCVQELHDDNKKLKAEVSKLKRSQK